ncbi:MAG: hypothetical protein GX794_03205 [Acholeplasmataceae bacterium]|nr:hypothetical protein [Acholeplasmataceae bacterium]
MDFFQAAFDNDIKTLLKAENLLEMKNIKGQTLLHFAIFGGSIEAASFLINQGIDVNATDHSGENALFDCARRSKLELAKLLILNNANPNIANRKDELPIHLAAHRGDEQMVKLLIEANSILNKKTLDDRLPIHYAILGGQLKIIPSLMKLLKISYLISDEYGNTLLHYAARTTNVEMISFLISQGIDVNSLNDQLESPLFSAVKTGSLDVVKLFIQEEALLDIKNRRYETPFDIAVIYEQDNIIKYLDDFKLTPKYEQLVYNNQLILAVLNRDTALLKELLAKNIPLNKNKQGYDALDYAKKYKFKLAVDIINNK